MVQLFESLSTLSLKRNEKKVKLRQIRRKRIKE